MTDSRARILARIRAGLAKGRGPGAPPEIPTPRPQWREDGLARLRDRLEAAAATLVQADSPWTCVMAIAAYQRENDLSGPVVVADHPQLRALPWPYDLGVEYRPIRASDQLAVTVAHAGVAETGSLVLVSGPATPTRLNLLPEHFLCLLPASRILSHLEDVWELLRNEPGMLPRTVSFVTGPSRTADVEQTVQLGAHGPRRVHVIIT
jgi:hypothetical protein